MPSSKFVELAKQIVRKHPEMFESLMEYERTGKLPKPNPKIRANFTIDARAFRSYREYCKKHGCKMSSRIEKFMQEELSKASRKHSKANNPISF